MIEDAAKRFGKEKLAVSLNDFDALFKHQHLIQDYSSEIVFMHQTGSEFHYECNRCTVCDYYGYDGEVRVI